MSRRATALGLALFFAAGLVAGDIYFAGERYSKVYIGGVELTSAYLGGARVLSPRAVDRPGTLSVSVTISSGRRNFVFSVTDPDGIRAISSATVRARDGQTADVIGDFSRSDANTFAGTDTRRNARWNSGSLTVVYLDATSGQSRTLTQTWAVS